MAVRRRVLHIVPNLQYGGMEKVVAELVRGVDPKLVESHVLCLQYLGHTARGLDQVATLHTAPRLPSYSMVWPGPLIRQIRAIAPDVVHTHSGVWYKASLAARYARVPLLIHTDHGRPGVDTLLDCVIDRLASQRTDMVIAVSEALREYLVRHRIASPRRLRVLRNGVNTDAFRPEPSQGHLQAELGLAPEVPVLGSVGRFDRIKGYDVMIEAFALLRTRWRGEAVALPALAIAGEGDERANLEALIRARGLEDRVRLLGWRDDIQRLYADFTVFTLSSWSEGTSLSLLEAMSMGLCPVVTHVGGNPAVVGSSLRHRLVAPGDAEALATAWEDVLLNPAARAADSGRARARVLEAYSLSAMVSAYEALYLGHRDGHPQHRHGGNRSGGGVVEAR